ncbi:MAG: hypothetical protein ACHQUB_03400 [Candidatus Saccharimonadia bacterium]
MSKIFDSYTSSDVIEEIVDAQLVTIQSELDEINRTIIELQQVISEQQSARACKTELENAEYERKLETARLEIEAEHLRKLSLIQAEFQTELTLRQLTEKIETRDNLTARLRKLLEAREKYGSPKSSPPTKIPKPIPKPRAMSLVVIGVLAVALLGLVFWPRNKAHNLAVAKPKLSLATPLSTEPATTTTLPAWQQWPSPVLSQWESLAQTVAKDPRITTRNGNNFIYGSTPDPTTGVLHPYDHWQLIMAAVTIGCGGNPNCPQQLSNGNWGGMIPMQITPTLIDVANELNLSFSLSDPETNMLIWSRYINESAERIKQLSPQGLSAAAFRAQLVATWQLPDVQTPNGNVGFWSAATQNSQDFWSLYDNWDNMSSSSFAVIEFHLNGRIAKLLDAAHKQSTPVQGG